MTCVKILMMACCVVCVSWRLKNVLIPLTMPCHFTGKTYSLLCKWGCTSNGLKTIYRVAVSVDVWTTFQLSRGHVPWEYCKAQFYGRYCFYYMWMIFNNMTKMKIAIIFVDDAIIYSFGPNVHIAMTHLQGPLDFAIPWYTSNHLGINAEKSAMKLVG